MAIRKQLHDVLAITAELTNNNVNEDVRHTSVIDRVGMPEHETLASKGAWPNAPDPQRISRVYLC